MLQRQALAGWWQIYEPVFYQALMSGFLMGGIYSLAAIGFTLIFGVLGVINFAHGAFMAVGMYVTLVCFNVFGIDPYLSLLICIPLLFFIGGLIYKFAFLPIMDRPIHNQLLLGLGLALFIANLLWVVFTGDAQTIQGSFSGARVFIGNIMVSLPRLFAFGGGIIAVAAIFLLLRHTELGKAIRASAEEKEGAALVGINVDRVHLTTFGLGIACAGAAGSLIMPFFVLTPHVGDTFVLLSFAIVVLGGLGSVVGSLIGGIIIGLVESIGAIFLPGSSKLLGVFLILALILLFRPSGLLGKK
jgi:branched-chain amino acid transport system permease protein